MARPRTKMQPKLLNVNRIPSQPKKRKKFTVVFDERKRREFLTGFRKRKLERKLKAKETLQQQLKEERKRIKLGICERYKRLLSGRNIPEIQQMLSQEEYETEGQKVSILELNVADFAENNPMIGENKGQESEEERNNEVESIKDCVHSEEIIGMPLSEKKQNKCLKKPLKEEQIGTNKSIDLTKVMKKATLQQLKKSKAFKLKQNLERQKNKKESMRNRKRILKAQKRKQKK